jgi:hypothetical protein
VASIEEAGFSVTEGDGEVSGDEEAEPSDDDLMDAALEGGLDELFATGEE